MKKDMPRLSEGLSLSVDQGSCVSLYAVFYLTNQRMASILLAASRRSRSPVDECCFRGSARSSDTPATYYPRFLDSFGAERPEACRRVIQSGAIPTARRPVEASGFPARSTEFPRDKTPRICVTMQDLLDRFMNIDKHDQLVCTIVETIFS
jgi:hypothetical protein